MACYVICYDVVAGGDYEPLYSAIKRYGTWAHITESTWAIVSEKTHTEVRDDLGQYVPEGGRLFVVKSAKAAAWRNVLCRSEWLKENI